MSKNKKILIGILGLLVLLLLLLFFWFLWPKKTVQVQNSVTANQQAAVNAAPRETPKIETPVLTDQQVKVNQSGLESLAMTFAERYGSFSTDSDFANLKDVLDFMASGLRLETENYIVSAKPTANYYGVTTRVLSVEVATFDEAAGTAQVSVSTQREESVGSPQNSSIKYQNLLLAYVKEAGLWKVTSATWQ
ncbi:MAG: hypothetical protein V1664_00720 [Candidatus Uhrbacteria bacterium]